MQLYLPLFCRTITCKGNIHFAIQISTLDPFLYFTDTARVFTFARLEVTITELHWAPGEYVPEMTEERITALTELKEKVLQMSEGAPARSFIDTYEEQYEMQQSLGADV